MRILLTLLLLAGPAAGAGGPAPPAGAGVPLSLDEAVARALAESPGAREIAGTLALAGLDYEQARDGYRLRPFAFVNTDARSGTDTGRTFRAGVTRRSESGSRWTLGASNAYFADSYLSEVSVGYTLPFFQDPVASGRFTLDEAGLGFREQEQRAVIATETLVLEVIRAYFDLSLAGNNIQVAEGATALAERLLRATEIRVGAGRSSELDRQLARLRVAEGRQREQAATDSRDLAGTRLRTLLGYDFDAPLAVETDIPLATDTGTALLQEVPLIDLAMTRRRDLVALRDDTGLAKRKLVAGRSRLPAMDITVQYSLVGEGTSFSESSSLDEGRLGIGIAMDLTSPGSVDEVTRRLLLQYESRQRSLARLEADIRAAVQAALFGVKDAAARQKLARQAGVLALQQLRLAERLYLRGTGTTEDMLEKQQAVLDTRQQELATRVQLLMANYQLQAATGTLLDQWQP